MTARNYSDVWVCVDCYVAHSYGATEVDGKWYVGDDRETPAHREPLWRLEGSETADNTNSETGDGIDTFSWEWCEGCDSNLGGSRYRLALFDNTEPLEG